MNFIINKYKIFITFINEIIDRVKIKLFILKNEMNFFLIYNYKSFIIKNYKLILFI